MLTRRQVLKILGLSSVLAGTPFDRLLHVGASVDAASTADIGELYAGFLLLPNGTPLPSAVQFPPFGIPIVCALDGQGTTAISTHFDTHADVRKNVHVPLYTFSNVPSSLRPAGGDVIEYEWGTLYTASLAFQSYNAATGTWDGGVSLWAVTEFPQPFPFWFDPASAPGDTGWPEKVTFLPTPGLRVASGLGIDGRRLGYVFYWMNNAVLYWLRMENTPSHDEAQALAASLVTLT